MSEFNLIKANREQMQEVAHVFKKSRTVCLPFLPLLHSIEEDIDFFKDKVFFENEIVLAVHQSTCRISGFIAFNKEWVNHLYLLPHVRGQGLGSKLLSSAQQSREKLQLWVFQKNSAARAFYTKHGFTVIRETDGNGNEEKEPDILMLWEKQI
jgi:putative acetyltransferase